MQKLHQAVRDHDVILCRRLLADNANVDALSEGMTALHLAIELRDRQVAAALIDGKADINFLDNFSTPPIITAIIGGDLMLVEMLHRAGARLDTESFCERGAVFEAVPGRPSKQAILAYLLSHGADPSAVIPDPMGGSTCALHRAALRGFVAPFRTLLDAGARMDFQPRGGGTLLHVVTESAAPAQALEMGVELLHRGVDPEVLDNKGRTAADIARARENPKLLQTITAVIAHRHLSRIMERARNSMRGEAS
jgi:ankyrin repeat protein